MLFKKTRNIDRFWSKICENEGETFFTPKHKKPYTYTVKNDYIIINNDSRRKITKTHLEKAMLIANPIPSKLADEGIWGPSYVCGIITDSRIV